MLKRCRIKAVDGAFALTSTALVWAALGVSLPAGAMEPLSDGQLGAIEAQGLVNLKLENIRFIGVAQDGAPAGSVNDIASDQSALLRDNYAFRADAIGTDSNPVRFGGGEADFTTNAYDGENVVKNGHAVGRYETLHIALPDKSAWQNVDFEYDASYRNPDVIDLNNRNIQAGGTPSSREKVAYITIDDLSIEGAVDIAGIAEGHKIRSVYVDDGSREAETSRQGLMMNLNIKELLVKQWLFEANERDGVFDPETDIVINNFRLANMQLIGATYEMTEKGLRIAYSNPQPFTKDEGLLLKSGGGYPDTAHSAYNPNFPKGELTLQTQMPYSLPNESRIRGVTLDHLVLNIRN